MATVSVALNTTEAMSGKKLQKTLTDIRDTATSAQIKTFTTALNSLTTNVYGSTNRIEKLNVDTEETSVSKPVPVLTLSEFVSGSATVTYSGDGTLVLKVISGAIVLNDMTVTASGAGEGILYALATANYAAAVLPFTVSA